MEADLARVLGALDIEGEKLGKVLQGEPWLFEGHWILIQQWEAEMKVGDLFWRHIPCWVQIWNLPLGYVDVDFGRAIGAYIGEVIEVDHRSIEQE
ncbi:hypothetical protein LIER_33449 [Lithospermum erythrorhizon]|uniref:DUF4283 domain-containing protein n=1 Tax=Lithospermum erythrorhizon TaxID=34254 RepID=A0AAV3S2H6_LITER